jgi:hypothetical protein
VAAALVSPFEARVGRSDHRPDVVLQLENLLYAVVPLSGGQGQVLLEPRVLENAVDVDSIRRVDLEDPAQQVFQALRYCHLLWVIVGTPVSDLC